MSRSSRSCEWSVNRSLRGCLTPRIGPLHNLNRFRSLQVAGVCGTAEPGESVAADVARGARGQSEHLPVSGTRRSLSLRERCLAGLTAIEPDHSEFLRLEPARRAGQADFTSAGIDFTC